MTRSAPPAAAALLLTALAACSGSAPTGAPGGDAVPVRAGVVAARDVPVTVRTIGTVEAYSTVEIKAQVNGVLQEVHFREGQDVRRGNLLFVIDPRPYQAALEAARAQLARDSVQLKTARQDVGRYKDLAAKDYVTKEEFDRIQTNAESLEATVRADEAAVQNAIGGENITTTVEGRERYPVNVRYLRDFRSTLDRLNRTLGTPQTKARIRDGLGDARVEAIGRYVMERRGANRARPGVGADH